MVALDEPSIAFLHVVPVHWRHLSPVILSTLRSLAIAPGPVQTSQATNSGIDMAPTPLDILTLVLALLGLVVAICSLVWQAVEYRLTGGRVEVALKVVWMDSQTQQAVSGHPGNWERGSAPTPSFDMELFGAEARNVGRLPVSVTGWWIGLGVVEFGHFVGPLNPPLPKRLEVGEAATWVVEREKVKELIPALTDQKAKVRAGINLGSGKKHLSKNYLKLSEV